MSDLSKEQEVGPSQELLDRILEEGIKANVRAIAEIVVDGAIAVLVFEPHSGAMDALRAIGLDSASKVFELSRTHREGLAQHVLSLGDQRSADWLTRKAEGRIFVFVHGKTLFINFDERDGGYSIEPGSLDGEFLN